MSNADLFLKKALGEDFFESLAKVELYKYGTRSVLDIEEIKTALQIVPRTIIALLIRELSPMNVGDTKEIPLLVGVNAMIRATKHERDCFSGDVEEDSKKIAEFKFRSLPGVGLIIMSAFELYDMENLINSPSASDLPMAPAPLSQPNFAEDIDSKVQKLIDERLALHSLVEQVVEKKIAHKDAIHQMMLAKLTEEISSLKNKMVVVSAKTELARKEAEVAKQLNPAVFEIEEEKETPTPMKKSRPLQEFLEKRKKPKEFSVQMAKGEMVSCPDCGKDIFNGNSLTPCICYGDYGKIFLKKTENGIKVRFSRSWDIDNIEMLLELLRKKNKHV